MKGVSLAAANSGLKGVTSAEVSSPFDGLPFPTVQYFVMTVGAATVPVLARLVHQWCHSDSGFSVVTARFLWVAAFIINLGTVSIPGRFDGLAVEAKNRGDTSPGYQYRGGIPWTPVFAPAGWAFAIWGVIYLGEMAATAFIGARGGAALLQGSLSWWIAGSLFQALWCGCFRPAFSDHLYIPSTLLACAAASQLANHAAMTDAINDSRGAWNKVGLIMLRFPISLHASWLCAAALLNFNGWFARAKLPMSRQVALAGASAYLASALAAVLTLMRGDPFLALTVAWALKAVAVQTTSDSATQVLNLPQVTKESLSETESALSALLTLVAAAAPLVTREVRRL